MWRFLHFLFRIVAGIQYHVERRLTPAGMIVAGTLIAAAALGVDTNQTVAYKLFGLAAALLAVAGASLAFIRSRFSTQRTLPRVVTAGEPFTYRVTVTNLTPSPRDACSLVEDLDDPRPSLADFRARYRFPTYRRWKRMIAERRVVRVDEVALPAIAPHATVEARVRGRALHRGSQHFRGLTVARADPLRLVKSLRAFDAAANLLVLPRRYALPAISLPGSRKYQPGGVALAASVGDSEEFMSLRDYRPGDAIQRIHWKSFARAGEPVVKEYQDEFFERHALVLDTFAARGQTGAFEEAVSVAASFAYTVSTQECLLDLMFIGAESYCHTAGRGQLSAGNLLEILAGVQPCHDRSLQMLLDAVVARRSALTGCICILLGWDAGRAHFVRTLQSLGVPLLVLAVATETPPDAPPWLHVLVPGKIQEGLVRL